MNPPPLPSKTGEQVGGEVVNPKPQEKMIRRIERLTAALQRIAEFEGAPDIDATGDWQFGLHCGVEDRDCQDRYQGADYGHAVGVEKALEWARNEASYALECETDKQAPEAIAAEPSTSFTEEEKDWYGDMIKKIEKVVRDHTPSPSAPSSIEGGTVVEGLPRMKSNCCNAEMEVCGIVTLYYVCKKCNKACDAQTDNSVTPAASTSSTPPPSAPPILEQPNLTESKIYEH